MNIISRLVGSLRKASGAEEWQPVARPGMYVPVQMRKRASDGSWLYRPPTEQEIQDYVANEAW